MVASDHDLVPLALEICVSSIAGVCAAIAGGADRIELCSALSLGGLTPSIGLVTRALELARSAGVALHALVRPVPGGFAYGSDAQSVIARDSAALIAAGVDGLVFGMIAEGRLDRQGLQLWRDLVREESGGRAVSCTLHRAIDLSDDPIADADVAAQLGFDYILSSGGQPNAWQGRSVLAAMVHATAGRCRIVAGGGVRADNVLELLQETNVRDLHASARGSEADADIRIARLGFVAPVSEQTDSVAVAELARAMRRRSYVDA